MTSPGNESATDYPIPARLNLAIIATQCLAFIAIFWLASRAAAWWQVGALALCFALLGNSIYSIIHEAEHGILHPNRKINDAMGVLMALLFPAPFHLIRQGHLGHHRRNRSDDEAFDLYFAGDQPWLKWLILYGILTGFYWMLVVLSNLVVVFAPGILDRRYFEFDRPSVAFMESLNPKYRKWIRLEGLAACLLHPLLMVLFQIPVGVYVAVYFGFGFSWSAMQYVHHFGTERHVLHGTRDLWIARPIDWIWLNHNWHHVHHCRPTVPWIYLERIGEQQGREREFLIWRYLKMWRGPRKTDERVENKYAGKLIP